MRLSVNVKLYPPPYIVKLNFRIYKRLLSNLIIYATVGATCGRPSIHSKLKTGEHSSPLRYDIEFNLIATVINYVFVNYLGGSKPPPYTIGYIIQFVWSTNFCGLRKPHIQPPLCKGRCRTNVRRRDCKVNFICFYKLPQPFFVMQKMTAPSKMGRKHELNSILYRRDNPCGCP